MSRFALLLLVLITVAGCGTNGGRLFNDPPSADASDRAGTRGGTTAGAGGTVKGL